MTKAWDWPALSARRHVDLKPVVGFVMKHFFLLHWQAVSDLRNSSLRHLWVGMVPLCLLGLRASGHSGDQSKPRCVSLSSALHYAGEHFSTEVSRPVIAGRLQSFGARSVTDLFQVASNDAKEPIVYIYIVCVFENCVQHIDVSMLA